MCDKGKQKSQGENLDNLPLYRLSFVFFFCCVIVIKGRQPLWRFSEGLGCRPGETRETREVPGGIHGELGLEACSSFTVSIFFFQPFTKYALSSDLKSAGKTLTQWKDCF